MKRLLVLAVLLLCIQTLTDSCGASVQETAGNQDTMKSALMDSMADGMGEILYGQFLPGIAFAAEGRHGTHWLLQEQIDSLIPFYGYLTGGVEEEGETVLDLRTILLAEAEEELCVMEEMPETGLPEGAVLLEIADLPEGETIDGQTGFEPEQSAGEALDDLLWVENEAALQLQFSSFMPHEKQAQVSLEPLQDFDLLLQQFYNVDANTVAGSDQLDVGKLLEADMTIDREGTGPQILIYHTHSQEAFADSVEGDESTSIMGVGDRLTEILTQEYGYEVYHHRGKYDVESRDNAYANALTDLEQVLKENPSIQVVIDLHRDAMPEETRLVMDLDGRPTARFMFFNGLSRTKKTGNIAYLYNENLDSNLAFSFQMQLKAMEYYPGLTRKIYLKGYRYNMHLCPKYLLIELGAQNNTVEEAMNACDPLAHILDMVLSGE